MIKKYLAGRKERIEAGEYGSIIVGNIMQKKYEIKSKKINKRMEKLRELSELQEAKNIAVSNEYMLTTDEVKDVIDMVNRLFYAVEIASGELESYSYNLDTKRLLLDELLKKNNFNDELGNLSDAITTFQHFNGGNGND
ncbi:hypothetical protein ACMGE9_02620 [Macrococcus sp. EM39E]|uniref:hypothetical protein n=1 Tax=Macrococcus animalis TaxID=3395467 RepID=UPI0039BDB6C2